MADNFQVNTKTTCGVIFASDCIMCIHYPMSKLVFGGADVATSVTACCPFPVCVKNTTIAVTDNCGALTVDNGGTFAVQVDGAALTALQLIDNIVQTEDSVHSTGDSGVMALAVRQDSQVDFGADGDYVPFSIDANGALRVSGGGGGTEYCEDAATPATIVGTATLIERDDALSCVTPIEGDWIALRGSARGALWVVHDTSVAIPVTDNCGTLTVGNAGTFATQVDGAALTALQLIDNIVVVEDAVHGSGDSGVMALAVRNDCLAALAGTDGDYAPLQVNASGALFIQEGAALDVSGATVTVDLGANNDVTIDASSIVLAEDAVHSSGAAGVMALAVRNDCLAALAGTDGDYAPIQVNADGAAFVQMAPAAKGGTTAYRNLDVDESDDQVKASAGQIFWIHAINVTAAPIYLKIYNAPAACVTVGGACATTPIFTFPVPGNADSDGAGFVLNCPQGVCLGGTGITVAATTGVADCDTGAPGANELILNMAYK